jgi:hypothetical protein
MSNSRGPLSPSLITAMMVVVYIAGATVVGLRQGNETGVLSFSPQGITNVGQTLAPLIAIAAFIERGVEVVIASLRGLRGTELERELSAATASGDPQAKRTAQKAVDDFKAQTQRYAFLVSSLFSVSASLVGVRALQPLLALPASSATATYPVHLFAAYDVFLTSVLLAGGSDGIHQIVTTVTGFLDATKASNNKRDPA